jgi:CheY-like chemotaxis protein
VKTVLIVDDEFALSDTLKEFLEDEGYSAESVGDGKDALESMAKNRPDLVISDMMMPAMDGCALLHAMRNSPALKSIPVLLMSSVRRQTVMSRAALLEFSGFLHKPFKLDAFLDQVVELIGPGEKRDQ